MGVWVRAPSSLIGCTPVVLEELPVPRDSTAAAVAAPRAEKGVSGAGLSAQVPMKVARQGGEGVELGETVAADVVTVLSRDFPPKVSNRLYFMSGGGRTGSEKLLKENDTNITLSL